jgi:hypothetical protein
MMQTPNPLMGKSKNDLKWAISALNNKNDTAYLFDQLLMYSFSLENVTGLFNLGKPCPLGVDLYWVV